MDESAAGDDNRRRAADFHGGDGGDVVLPDAQVFPGRVSANPAGGLFARDARGPTGL